MFFMFLLYMSFVIYVLGKDMSLIPLSSSGSSDETSTVFAVSGKRTGRKFMLNDEDNNYVSIAKGVSGWDTRLSCVEYTLNCISDVEVQLNFEVIAPDGASNSFWVQVGSKSVAIGFPSSSNWHWTTPSHKWFSSSGNSQVKICGRESGTKLRKISILEKFQCAFIWDPTPCAEQYPGPSSSSDWDPTQIDVQAAMNAGNSKRFLCDYLVSVASNPTQRALSDLAYLLSVGEARWKIIQHVHHQCKQDISLIERKINTTISFPGQTYKPTPSPTGPRLPIDYQLDALSLDTDCGNHVQEIELQSGINACATIQEINKFRIVAAETSIAAEQSLGDLERRKATQASFNAFASVQQSMVAIATGDAAGFVGGATGMVSSLQDEGNSEKQSAYHFSMVYAEQQELEAEKLETVILGVEHCDRPSTAHLDCRIQQTHIALEELTDVVTNLLPTLDEKLDELIVKSKFIISQNKKIIQQNDETHNNQQDTLHEIRTLLGNDGLGHIYESIFELSRYDGYDASQLNNHLDHYSDKCEPINVFKVHLKNLLNFLGIKPSSDWTGSTNPLVRLSQPSKNTLEEDPSGRKEFVYINATNWRNTYVEDYHYLMTLARRSIAMFSSLSKDIPVVPTYITSYTSDLNKAADAYIESINYIRLNIKCPSGYHIYYFNEGLVSCKINICLCECGIALTGTSCPNHGDLGCECCINDYYYLDGKTGFGKKCSLRRPHTEGFYRSQPGDKGLYSKSHGWRLAPEAKTGFELCKWKFASCLKEQAWDKYYGWVGANFVYDYVSSKRDFHNGKCSGGIVVTRDGTVPENPVDQKIDGWGNGCSQTQYTYNGDVTSGLFCNGNVLAFHSLRDNRRCYRPFIDNGTEVQLLPLGNQGSDGKYGGYDLS